MAEGEKAVPKEVENESQSLKNRIAIITGALSSYVDDEKSPNFFNQENTSEVIFQLEVFLKQAEQEIVPHLQDADIAYEAERFQIVFEKATKFLAVLKKHYATEEIQ